MPLLGQLTVWYQKHYIQKRQQKTNKIKINRKIGNNLSTLCNPSWMQAVDLLDAMFALKSKVILHIYLNSIKMQCSNIFYYPNCLKISEYLSSMILQNNRQTWYFLSVRSPLILKNYCMQHI